MITLQEARNHLQSTHNADDADLTLKIEAAVSAVLNYLQVADELDIPDRALPQAKAAALIIVAALYEEREGTEKDNAVYAQFGYGYLPRAAVSLLFPFRRLVLA